MIIYCLHIILVLIIVIIYTVDCEMGQWSDWSMYGKKVETISRKYHPNSLTLYHESKEYRLEVRNRTIVSKSYAEYCDSVDTPREQHRKCKNFKEWMDYSCKTEQECKEWPWDCRPLECEKQLLGSFMAISYFKFSSRHR